MNDKVDNKVIKCNAQKNVQNDFGKMMVALSTVALPFAQPALAQDYQQPNQPQQQQQAVQDQKNNVKFNTSQTQNAPTSANYKLPEGSMWRYSEFLQAVTSGKVERVRFSRDGSQLQLTAIDGRRAMVTLPNDPDLVDILARNGVDISVSEGDQQGNLPLLIGNLIFPILAFAALFFFLNQNRNQSGQQGGGFGGMGGPGGFGGMNNPMNQGKSKFTEVTETGVKFDDVAGVEGAKLELREIVDFLSNAQKYTQLGAKVPKGALLVGPPGTGKTLLAKAVAGEAGVPFFSCAASEFVELFVGVGASRVRDLFEKAKQKAPCIIFVDEIDAVGRQRGAGMGQQNDEREQTINQLLTELDGFEGNTGVIVIAATNRPDVLDKALLRPGRFDRQISVERPDLQGRIQILMVHARGKTLSSDFDFDNIARRTPGFTGADLQNLMNEAAILTARQEKKEVSNEEVNDALDKIMAGPEKLGSVIKPGKKKLVAYHESGHAIVGALMPDYDPVTKISIVPRGNAGGITFFAPSEERLESQLYSKSYLENQMAVALGGRVAEELIFGPEDLTTGAQGDFQQVSRVARLMVTQLGFSELGQIAWTQQGGNQFLGQSMAQPAEYSMETANLIDNEVRQLVERAYRRAKDLMQTNMDLLHKLAGILQDKEDVDGQMLNEMIREVNAKQYLKDDEPKVLLPYQTAGASA